MVALRFRFAMSIKTSCVAWCRGSKLPSSLEVVRISRDNHSNLNFEMEQWLPVLAALPFCHSLALPSNVLQYWEFDAMAVRCGLATSPSLRLLVIEHEALPALAAERTVRGLPCVVLHPIKSHAAGRFRVTETTPSARFGQCALLPSVTTDRWCAG